MKQDVSSLTLTENEIWLRTIAKRNDVTITDIQLQQLGEYAKLLKSWNQSLNLISRKDEENIWQNHILLSLSFIFKIAFLHGSRIIDLGTGGGLPGIPLSIARPDVSLVLIDSIRKKTAAVQNMVNSLGLTNATVACGRAEDLNILPKYRMSFDAVIARSVSSLENIVAWGLPFLKKGGAARKLSVPSNQKVALTFPSIITMKGGDISDEIERVLRRFPHLEIHSVNLLFAGDEILQNSEKKIILVENN